MCSGGRCWAKDGYAMQALNEGFWIRKIERGLNVMKED